MRNLLDFGMVLLDGLYSIVEVIILVFYLLSIVATIALPIALLVLAIMAIASLV